MTRLCLWCAFAVFLQWTVTGQQLVSQGKPITSSSQYHTWSADKAVDGNKTPLPDTCDCCAGTNYNQDPWYKLDLEQTYMVLRINVSGGSEYIYQNFREMEIKLGISSEDGTVLTKNTANVPSYDYILPSPQLGRYVTLTLRGIFEFFVICEFEVYAACEGGRYGPDCISNCGNCLNNATCDKQDGRCNACAAGYKGDKCLELCDRFTYGMDCKERCGSCADNVPCNRFDGSCPNGCRPGFKAELCKEECEVNTYGNSCTPCGHCLNDMPCDNQDGTCGSCAAGYTGNKCVETCSDGSYGIDCQLTCGKCHRQSICLKDTGNCHQGCEPGFLGPLCHRECKDGTYGEGCTSICGNCHGDEICNKQNGTCQACECGYTGHDCKGEINPPSSSSDCPNIALLFGGALVSILAIEGVAAAIFFLIRKRRCSLKRDTINRSNPYELPNRTITEGEHDYESAMELDVDTNAYENTGQQAT